MQTPLYLIDNMVICSKALAPYIELDFVRSNCAVIDEVVYESRNSMRASSIKKLQQPLRAKDLELLKAISQDCIEKYKILDLYEGSGDALLLATALATNEPNDRQLSMFTANKPTIVTEEKAVRRACDDFNLQWMSQKDFISLIRTVINQQLPL